MKEKILVSWSGGKDCALALYELLRAGDFEIVALLTTITEDYDKVSMHGIRTALIDLQGKALGIPVEKVHLANDAANKEYEERLTKTLTRYKEQGVKSFAFGDLYLDEVRKYREKNLARIAMEAVFPLWGRDTNLIAQQFINSAFKAVVTCVDSRTLDKTFIGRSIDKQFLSELPVSVDCCGENGEYHSFVYDGPIFNQRISHQTGQVVLRDNRFYYLDLMPLFD
jgi:uncharacterized protein (TIGR00290 family)